MTRRSGGRSVFWKSNGLRKFCTCISRRRQYGAGKLEPNLPFHLPRAGVSTCQTPGDQQLQTPPCDWKDSQSCFDERRAVQSRSGCAERQALERLPFRGADDLPRLPKDRPCRFGVSGSWADCPRDYLARPRSRGSFRGWAPGRRRCF